MRMERRREAVLSACAASTFRLSRCRLSSAATLPPFSQVVRFLHRLKGLRATELAQAGFLLTLTGYAIQLVAGECTAAGRDGRRTREAQAFQSSHRRYPHPVLLLPFFSFPLRQRTMTWQPRALALLKALCVSTPRNPLPRCRKAASSWTLPRSRCVSLSDSGVGSMCACWRRA